jgi:hypothetical protein
MYQSVEIHHFRGLENVKIDGLAWVNLITGPNNVGKTSVLEAILIQAGGASAVMLASTTEALRGAQALRLDFREGGVAIWDSDFFNFDTSFPVVIKVTMDDGEVRQVSLRTPLSTTEIQPHLIPTGTSVSTMPSRSLDVEVSVGNHSTTYHQFVEPNGFRIDPPADKPLPAALQTSGPPNHQALADFFSTAVRRGLKAQLTDALNALDTRIYDLELLQYGGYSMIHAHIHGVSVPIPLHLVGEGTQRLLNALLNISANAGGVVCIDEIDGGIHYSALPEVFKEIYEMAKVNDVQVVATTHSQNCVAGALEGLKDFDALRLFRLARNDSGSVESFVYDQDAIEGALSLGLDLR